MQQAPTAHRMRAVSVLLPGSCPEFPWQRFSTLQLMLEGANSNPQHVGHAVPSVLQLLVLSLQLLIAHKQLSMLGELV